MNSSLFGGFFIRIWVAAAWAVVTLAPALAGEPERHVRHERRLPAAGKAGDDHELVSWDRNRDILEIMLLCPEYFNNLTFHYAPPEVTTITGS